MKTQQKYEKSYSFEFFPPKTEEGAKKLRLARSRLDKLNPNFYSVTFGAGGSTQEGTYETVAEIIKSGGDAAPHLSCIGSTRDNIRELLQRYKDAGVRRIVTLRGDMPSGMRDTGEFRYANELVEFIRAETGDTFKLEVAAYPEFHPQAPTAFEDLENFKRKVDAGANTAITQYFFNADAYFRFVDDCERMGIDLPIVPGIMPITNYKQLARFSDACGAEIPRWIRQRLIAYGDDMESLGKFGEEVVSALCQRLLDAGVPGIHFYVMNRSAPTIAIWKNLGLPVRD
ncbi:methylenetetrahydrofolate reductase [Thiohalobacter sp. COW1]|uniref:Methylenetetrahydrofolate reductase n=1 Tax=Thiohalobacter thiocyanaticus TaxID=585455 RepID=A0A1Z4VV45_9GAMM|nr:MULTISPECIES: methylenetetrahydrofolate reductase [NAD(P)H] [Thiohalobacter]BAZ95345.1 5,10-methylenetetrahydrofolate reductase [Thiohalobacter thiocyanaticus]BCO32703.1 methylenetetrahydrofolate reductase [Thiohalobacter sp. COW1]